MAAISLPFSLCTLVHLVCDSNILAKSQTIRIHNIIQGSVSLGAICRYSLLSACRRTRASIWRTRFFFYWSCYARCVVAVVVAAADWISHLLPFAQLFKHQHLTFVCYFIIVLFSFWQIVLSKNGRLVRVRARYTILPSTKYEFNWTLLVIVGWCVWGLHGVYSYGNKQQPDVNNKRVEKNRKHTI